MTKYLLLLCLLFAPLSYAAGTPYCGGGSPKTWSATESGTQSFGPTSSAALGMDLREARIYRVSVCLTSGTLAGGEQLMPWVYSTAQAKWIPVHGNLLTVAGNGVSLGGCFGWTDTPEMLLPLGRIYYAAIGFGTNVTVSIDGWAQP
jgi:hypothetical protein